MRPTRVSWRPVPRSPGSGGTRAWGPPRAPPQSHLPLRRHQAPVLFPRLQECLCVCRGPHCCPRPIFLHQSSSPLRAPGATRERRRGPCDRKRRTRSVLAEGTGASRTAQRGGRVLANWQRGAAAKLWEVVPAAATRAGPPPHRRLHSAALESRAGVSVALRASLSRIVLARRWRSPHPSVPRPAQGHSRVLLCGCLTPR